MRELTEYEKTLTDLFGTNGRKGLHSYFVHAGMSDDDAESHIDTLHFNETVDTRVFVSESPIDMVITSQTDSVDVELSTTEVSPTKQVVTFVDGTTAEIDVLPDGTVINPVIPLSTLFNENGEVVDPIISVDTVVNDSLQVDTPENIVNELDNTI